VGTESERRDLDRAFGNALQIDSTMKYGYFTLRSGRRVKIGGKIDGFVDGLVVEAKHRKNRLFGRVPVYEQVQCECYMRITGTELCTHIESYNEESNVMQLKRNDKLWDDILLGLETYLDLLELG